MHDEAQNKKGNVRLSSEETPNSDRLSNHQALDNSQPEDSLATSKAFNSWLLLNYSTGPTGAMLNSYVPAVIQSMAHSLGHELGNSRPCRFNRNTRCLTRFGLGDIDYNSYFLYLDAIATASQGICTIALCGFADYRDNRKRIMIVCILLFGAFATPYAGLSSIGFNSLTASSVLYVLANTIQGAYGAMEFSYIPLFMRAQLEREPHDVSNLQRFLNSRHAGSTDDSAKLQKGSKVAVMGLLVADLGSITALLIGVVITYATHMTIARSWQSFMVAITVAGSMTIVLGGAAGYLLPSIAGTHAEAPSILLPFRNWSRLLRNIKRFPEPCKLCVAWVLWNTGWSSQTRLVGLLFRKVLGLDQSTPIYTVWSFTSIIFAALGSFSWMLFFPRARINQKSWAYLFLSIQLVCIVWGCMGINKSAPIGFKHGVEFWIEQVLFFGTASALRALNRTMYAALIPRGSEALFYAAQVILDLATGWIAPLVNGVIQNKTHELRFPMIPNVLLVLVAAVFYFWLDVEKGMKEAQKSFDTNESTK